MQSKRSGRAAGLLAVVVPALCCLAVSADAASLSGEITDATTGEPVPAATVRIAGTGQGVLSGDDGRFELPDVPEEDAVVVVQRVGYRLWMRALDAPEFPAVIRLEPVLLPGQDIVVTSSRAVRGESPVAFDNLTQQEIRQSYYAQDVPQLLTESPSVYAYSDNGNAIGYSYMSIRGFPQRRVSVLINGVPLNDPESHEVYWIDLPDLPESIDDAQIQRGVGTTLYGANSIGGTVNFHTDHYSPVREINVTSGFGSYDTRKFSVSGNSGLIDDRYTLYGRFSRIVSEGYRRGAWTDLWAYFFAVARYDEKWTNRINIFGGPEQTHLAYAGIPRWYLRGDTAFFDTSATAKYFTWTRPTGDSDEDRKYNAVEWEDATDNFNQPHYQFITEYRPDTNWLIENTLFYIKGKGYFDDLWFGAGYDTLQLEPFTQLAEDSSGIDTVTVIRANLLSPRLWVENDFWGIIPRVTRKHKKGALTVGGEFQWHRGLHWGEIRSANPVPPTFVPGHRFYDYKGRKIVATGFAQEVFTPVPEVTLTGALQYSYKQYKLFDDRFPNTSGQTVSHTTAYNFFSPRFGVTVRPRDDISVFGSVSYNEQEPTNEEIFDPKVFDADANSFFRNFDSTTGIGDDPIMKPERLIDYEFGAAISRDRWRVEANLFYMLFKDEIVPRGQVSTISGRSIRSNASSSKHQGIEIAAEARPAKGVTLKGNLAVNDNTFDEYVELFETDSTANRAGNTIAGSPKTLANLRASYDHTHFSASAHVFHSGRLYIDNSNAPETEIDPYTVLNTRFELKLEPIFGYPGLRLFVHVNNLLDEEYETGGAIDYLFSGFPLFIPAAKRNFYAGLRASL